MYNSYWEKMADILIHYSLGVQPGDWVWMMGELKGLPLLETLYVKLIQAGAHVSHQIALPGWDELFFSYANDAQLKRTCPLSLHLAQNAHKRIRLLAPSNTRSLSHVDPRKHTAATQATAPLLSTVMERSAQGEMDWVVTLYPTEAAAQEAGMGTKEYTEFVLRAAFLDEKDPIMAWRNAEARQQRLISFLETKKELRFFSPEGTDLTVNIAGMRWKNSCGKRNFPDGEVFTGPNLHAADGGVNGVVYFSFPAIWQQTIVEGIRLVFEKGQVKEATAKKNEAFLRAMLTQDPGASFMGEIALGTNEKIDRFSHNILLDEKIGGTFHAALGMGYPETGNTNRSALHWDMICDLRCGGKVWADGELFSQDGHFLYLN